MVALTGYLKQFPVAIVCKTASECPSVGAGDKLRCFITHCPAVLRGYWWSQGGVTRPLSNLSVIMQECHGTEHVNGSRTTKQQLVIRILGNVDCVCLQTECDAGCLRETV